MKTTLGNISTIRTGKLDANAAVDEGEFPFFTCAETVSRIDVAAFDTEAVLLAGNGNFNVKHFEGRFNAYQRTYVIEPNGVNGRFLYHLIRAQIPKIASKNRGSTIKYLRLGDIRDCVVEVPELEVQKQIVSFIEHCNKSIESVHQQLDPVPDLIEKFRQSVLAAAFRGDLTKEWREQNPDVEPASVLLERIRAERRERWIEDAAEKGRAKAEAKARKSGKSWTDEDNEKALAKEQAKAAKKYKEPEPVEPTGLPELPETWCWTNLDTIADVSGGLTKGKKRKPDDVLQEVPYLRVANVQRGYLDLNEVKTIPATPKEIEALKLHHGDVLFNEGGDIDKLGRGWVWQEELPTCINQNHVFRARIIGSCVAPKLLSHHGNSSFAQHYFLKSGKQSTNLASINMTKLRALPVPLQPLAEQETLLNAVTRLIETAHKSGAVVERELMQLEVLSQSILAASFNHGVSAENEEISAI